MEGHRLSSGSLCGQLNKMKPYMAMIFLQFGYAGLTIIAMIALRGGMNHYALAIYRHMVAAAVIAPFAVVLERKVRPRMTFSIFLKIIALGLLEPVMDQNLFYMGMKSTSATFTSAMCNILPALTFLMAYICRLEKVNIKKPRSQAKVAGTFVTVAGAMVMTLYKGPLIEMPWSRVTSHNTPKNDTIRNDWVKGSLMLIGSSFCWACFMILQAITLRTYPAELSLTVLICLAGAVEGTIVALAFESGNTAIWTIGWDSRLLAAIYAGIFCSGIAYYFQGVIMKTRGPVFVTAFSPLSMIVVAISGSFILKEEISLGRVLGAIIIVSGLYAVIWGKSKDHLTSSPPIDKKTTAPDPPTVGTKRVSPNEEFIAVDVSAPNVPGDDPLSEH